MKINFKQIAYNRTPMSRSKIDFLVIHDTSNRRSGANAEMHYVYFNSANRNASADFFVDDKQILQVNDYKKYYSWQCGDGANAYGINNRNSIGIEICINADSNYEVAVSKTVELVRYLMRELNIPISKVVRHWDASRKNCPGTMSANNWARWHQFKRDVQSGSSGLGSSLGSTVIRDDFWVQKSLNSLGYSLVVDGIIGPASQAAIRDFQGKNGLVADAIAGPLTKAKLEQVLENKISSAVSTKPDMTWLNEITWLEKAVITSDFGAPRDGYNHYGIDFQLLPVNAKIFHIGSPGIAYAKNDPEGYGKYVEVKLSSGLYKGWSVIYAHLSEFLITHNQEVIAGMPIGIQGNTGNASAPHLHFEVRNGWDRNAGRIDPRIYIRDTRNDTKVITPVMTTPPPSTKLFTNTEMQEALNRIGYNLVVDGVIGPITKGAIRSFQIQYNLTVDGIYGLQTDTKLKEVLSKLEEGQKQGLKAEIESIQKKLNSIGYKLVEDGSLGPLTQSAVEDFQKISKLTIDGIAGPQTEKKLSDIILNEKSTNVYKSVNILSNNGIIDNRELWIERASLDEQIYWLIFKTAQKFR